MPFDRTAPRRSSSGPWGSELVFLSDGGSTFSATGNDGRFDGLLTEGSADTFGVEEGIYTFNEEGKLRTVLAGGQRVGIGPYDKPEPGYMETVAAAFQTENMIGSGFASVSVGIPDAEFYKKQPGYDVYDHIQGYEEHVERFEQVYNPIAEQAVKADIDREKQNRDILAASGWAPWLLSTGAASILDPTILIPGGAVVKAGRMGYSVAKTALNVGAHAGLATGVQEVGLHATQQLRTPEESFLAVGGSVILGGVIGSSGARIVPLNEIGSHTSGSDDPA